MFLKPNSYFCRILQSKHFHDLSIRYLLIQRSTGTDCQIHHCRNSSFTMKPEELHSILEEHSTKKYGMEYRRFLSNHISHGFVALYYLGVDRSRMDRFASWYNQRLEKPETQPTEVEPFEGDLDSIKGKRMAFYARLKHYQNLLNSKYENNLEKLVAGEFVSLYQGMACSALHGLIQLGYGFNIKHPQIVTEGLAYLHHSYLPLTVVNKTPTGMHEKIHGELTLPEALEILRNDEQLTNYVFETAKTKEWQDRDIGSFQRPMGVLLTTRGDQLMELGQKVKVPDDVIAGGPIKIMEWILDCAIWAYCYAERRNDFFLLHGVTGAWSLTQILPTISDPQTQLDICYTFICILFACYVTQRSPKISPEIIREMDPDWKEMNWKSLIDEALGKDLDEHVYKLLQVAKERFGVIKDNEEMYLRAAYNAVKNDLSF